MEMVRNARRVSIRTDQRVGEARPSVWRLLRSGPRSGQYNMAVDEAILDAAIAGKIPSTLRLYGWHPPALSIGYFQVEEDFRRLLESPDIDIVRRLTGGGAIHHGSEVTFCLVSPIGTKTIPEGVEESYDKICHAIICGLDSLGIEAHVRGGDVSPNPVSGAERTSPYYCFERPSRFDVVAGGRKIAGSAQRRKDGILLHHGSMPIENIRVPACSPATGASGEPVSFSQLCGAVLCGFRTVFQCDFAEGDLSEFEDAFIAGRLCGLRSGRVRGID